METLRRRGQALGAVGLQSRRYPWGCRPRGVDAHEAHEHGHRDRRPRGARGPTARNPAFRPRELPIGNGMPAHRSRECAAGVTKGQNCTFVSDAASQRSRECAAGVTGKKFPNSLNYKLAAVAGMCGWCDLSSKFQFELCLPCSDCGMGGGWCDKESSLTSTSTQVVAPRPRGPRARPSRSSATRR